MSVWAPEILFKNALGPFSSEVDVNTNAHIIKNGSGQFSKKDKHREGYVIHLYQGLYIQGLIRRALKFCQLLFKLV